MISWDVYSKRRKIDFNLFIEINGLHTKEDVIDYLNKIGVESPSDQFLSTYFAVSEDIRVDVTTEPLVETQVQSEPENSKTSEEILENKKSQNYNKKSKKEKLNA